MHCPTPAHGRSESKYKGRADGAQEFSADLRHLGANMAGWPEDKRQRALAMVVHACDIGNPAKPLALCLQWTQHIIAENFAQVGPHCQACHPRDCAPTPCLSRQLRSRTAVLDALACLEWCHVLQSW